MSFLIDSYSLTVHQTAKCFRKKTKSYGSLLRMNNDKISIISLDSSPIKDIGGSEEEEAVYVASKRGPPSSLCKSHQHAQALKNELENDLEQHGNKQYRNGVMGIKQFCGKKKRNRIRFKGNLRENKAFSKFRDTSRSIAVLIGIMAACVLCAVPWTTIPRTNSILFQAWWMELTIPTASFWFM